MGWLSRIGINEDKSFCKVIVDVDFPLRRVHKEMVKALVAAETVLHDHLPSYF